VCILDDVASRKKNGKKRKRPNRKREVAYQVEREGEAPRVYEDFNEAFDDAFKNFFPDHPPDATYREREFQLSNGGSLHVFEEEVPGDDPTKRRVFTIESSPADEGADGAEPRAPAIWKQPDREPGLPEYDVAVTFAGEDRTYVEVVVARLRDQGVRVFYDVDEQARLWGHNLLEELVDTYRARALRVLMFVSEAYAEKAWPTQERRTALERAMQSGEPYVLPVLLDDTVVPGLPATTAHIDGRKITAVEVADLTIEHLRGYGYDVPPPLAQQEMARRVSVRAIPSQTPDGKWEAPYEIHNGSDYPIHDVVLVINDPGQEGDPADQMGTAVELVVGTIGAGAAAEGRIDHMHFTRDPVFGELPYLATLLFRDESGNYWATSAKGLTHRRYPPRIC
jgi:hypothetical protein